MTLAYDGLMYDRRLPTVLQRLNFDGGSGATVNSEIRCERESTSPPFEGTNS